MAYSSINIGTNPNDGTGDTLFDTMTKINSNDLDIQTDIDLETATRITDLADCAKHNISNEFEFPIATGEYQTITGNSVVLDFNIEKPHNFYLPHGIDIYLDAPVGLSAGFYPRGWILTEGFITNWQDTFIEGDDNTKPLTYRSYAGQGLYLYYVLSPDTIVFRKFKTEQIIETVEDAVLYPVTFDSLTEGTTELSDGTYATELIVEWTKNELDTTDTFRVTVHNGTDTVYDSSVIDTKLIISPIKDTGIEHTVTIYATDGRSLSEPVSDTIIPTGDYSALQLLSGLNLTLSNTSLWGRDDLGVTTFYLDAVTGNVTMGNPLERNVQYDAATAVLNLKGTLRTIDIYDEEVVPNIIEYGKLATGDADYDVSTGESGTGVLIGSPGLFGVKDGGFTFGINNEGTVTLGGVDERNITYDAITGILDLAGTMRITDIYDETPDLVEYGKIATGDADYDITTGASGTGVMIGSPGIYGVKDGEFTFAVDISGNVVLGSDTDNRLSFTSATGVLETVGENRITDVGDPVTKYGYFGTGTAAYDTATDVVSGSGIIMGSPGLFGVYLGEITFHLNPITGELWMKGDTTIIGDEPTSGTTSTNGVGLANDAQRTADIALKNTLDVNLIVETLNRATKLDYNGGVDLPFEFKVI